MVVGRRSEIEVAHHLGPVLEEFLWEILPRNSSEENGRTIYQIAAKEPDLEEYATEFLRLSRFAPYIVSDEENRAE